MEINTGSINFARASGSGPRTNQDTISYPSNVTKAIAILTGTDFGYSPNNDHHLGTVDVKVDTNVQGGSVTVTATLGVRDWSGTWDDDYEGTVHYAVIAELA